MEKAAVIILNYNGLAFLEKFLPGVVKHSKGHHIYIADNSSTDNSVAFITNNFPDLSLLVLDKNYGFCGGYNRALSQVDEEYCILLNSDIEVTENWIEPLLETISKNDKVAAVQPKILSHHEKDRFEYAGAAGGFLDKFGYPFCRGRIFDHLEKDEGQYDDEREIFWATGACMMLKKSLFLRHGGFDERFFAHMEEIDLCWRFKNDGFKVMYCPSSKIYHVGGGTLPKNNPKKVFLNFRNSLFLLVKNLPENQLFYKIFIRLTLDFPAAFTFFFKGSIKSFFMVIWAHFHLYMHLPQLIKGRKKQLPNPKSHQGYYARSIVAAYFIGGKKKFTEL